MHTDDDFFLDMFESVTLAALDRIGDASEARHVFFRRFLARAQEVVGEANRSGSATKVRPQPP